MRIYLEKKKIKTFYGQSSTFASLDIRIKFTVLIKNNVVYLNFGQMLVLIGQKVVLIADLYCCFRVFKQFKNSENINALVMIL